MPDEAGHLARRVSTSLVVVALFLAPIVNGLYSGVGRGAPEFFPVLTAFLLSASLCAWFWDYSRRHRIAWIMDMGWFVFTAWVVVIPYFILKTEGRSGLGRIGLFCFAYLAALAMGWATQIWARLIFGAE